MEQNLLFFAHLPSTRQRPSFFSAWHAISDWYWRAAWPGILLALAALVLRLVLILHYPLLYDSDAYGRWANRDHPFTFPWVPLFQVVIYLLTRVANSILALQVLSAFFGATAVLTFWLLLRRAFDASVAYLGALLLVLNPLFVTFSVVPYQEGLFLTLAFLALWLGLAPGKMYWSWLIALVALAELTRYEGWLLALLLWLLFLWHHRQEGIHIWWFAARSALMLAWAPLLWIGVNRNISPVGTETLAPTLDPASLLAVLGTEWPAWQLNLGFIGGALALGGLLWLGWLAIKRQELPWLLLTFLMGDLLVIAFLRPFSPGNLRLPLLSLPVICVGVAGLLVTGARRFQCLVHQRVFRLPRHIHLVGAFAVVTVALLAWYIPLATQRVAAYDLLVRPAYLVADDLDMLAPNATVAVLGNETDFSAFICYAQQDGWHGQAIHLDAALVAPASLAEQLLSSHAHLLVAFGSASSDVPIAALVQQGFLVAAAAGSGYSIWQVHGPLEASLPFYSVRGIHVSISRVLQTRTLV